MTTNMSLTGYNQKQVISISNYDTEDLSIHALRTFVKKVYSEKLQGKTVINEHRKIEIHFSALGKNKLANGGAMYKKKALAVLALDRILQVAKFNNFGQRKPTDNAAVMGYLNFKAKVKINGELVHLRIAIILKRDGRFYYTPYYSHDANKK